MASESGGPAAAGSDTPPVSTDEAAEAVSRATTYDDIPYDSQPFARTQPSSLGVMATLFGMQPAVPERCRMLELGCAAGGNLIPLAAAAPDSEFVGVDLSLRQVEDGRELIAQTGLTNVRLEHLDIREVGDQFGKFDYIVSHGVYSWVPPQVQDAMFALCRQLLEPQGVAYISYNTFPGWHMRASVREMMNYHAKRFADPHERIEQSRALLDFLMEANAGSGSAYSAMLANELELLQVRRDSYLFHEHLEEYNEPEYFYRFMERANAAGLRFLGEATLGEMLPIHFEPNVAETIRRIAADIIHMEQYMDFLRNRTFRRTLLCHDEVRLERDLGPPSLRNLNIVSPLTPASTTSDSETGEEVEVSFEHPDGGMVTVRHPLEAALLMGLHEVAPMAVPFAELPELASTYVARGGTGGDDESIVFDTVMNLFSAGYLDARFGPDSFSRLPGERPRASVVARAQAASGRPPTNFLHEPVGLDEFRRRLLMLLDGTRDRVALSAEMIGLVEAGELTMHRDGAPIAEPAEIQEAIDALLEKGLDDLARMALLGAEEATT